MELEFFCKPGTDLEWFAYWKDYCANFLQITWHERGTYQAAEITSRRSCHTTATATTDIEYLFPFGWGELWGIADRTDFDLRQHSEHSGQEMNYVDSETGEKYIPYCIEPSLGADRVALAFLVEAYDEETLTDAKGQGGHKSCYEIPPCACAVTRLLCFRLQRSCQTLQSLSTKSFQSTLWLTMTLQAQ